MTIDHEPQDAAKHQQAIIEQLAASNSQLSEAYEKLREKSTEDQITITVLRDQLAGAIKDVTDTRVFASKLNMKVQELESALTNAQMAPVPAAYDTPMPVAPAPAQVVDPKPTPKRRGGKREQLLNGSAMPTPAN